MAHFGIAGTRSGRMVARTAVIVSVLVLSLFAQSGLAQQPLNFENNFFVTGDYVVGGWAYKQVDANRAGYATGKISIPDTVQTNAITVPQSGVPTQVPAGADIVAAFLYWTTVEKSQSAMAGQIGYFRGYQIAGAVLGNQNAPVSWSAGGCAGSSNGTTTMRVYRANVAPYLPVDPHGIVQPNTSYTVELADSGSGGNGTPFTLGATLVIVYRVLSLNFPLNAIVFLDGAFAPSNSSSPMTQSIQGFYQPAVLGPIAHITHIVGNGQSKKKETVSLNSSTTLPSLYGAKVPPFPGLYNGDWDNPTWDVSGALNAAPNDFADTTTVTPAASNSGCVSWGAIIFSTTVQDSDGDGLLDHWEEPPGPLNPVNPNGPSPGYTDFGTNQFVALLGANPNQKDIFVQLDYMCPAANVVTNGYTSTCSAGSFYPDDIPNLSGSVQTPPTQAVASAFAANEHNINVHIVKGNAIPETTCTDATSPTLCPYPDQPGVVSWKSGFSFLKNQPLNYPNESDCETLTVNRVPGSGPGCIRRFPFGRKDSWHYAIAANALGGANWFFQDGSLQSVVVNPGGTAVFTTSTAHKLTNNDPNNVGNGRVSIAGAISMPSLNGTFLVTPVTNPNPGDPSPHTFTIQTSAQPSVATNLGLSTDPGLSVASGQGDTGSGFSDLGGEDTLITLGLWVDDGKSWQVQAGTLMHELGHTIGLTHGGYYYDAAGSYVPTIEPNCKPNFQSVMSYLFQVDLLQDAAGNSFLDYSEEKLNALDETSAGAGLGTTFYANTSWYSPTAPSGTPSPAKRYCNGAPLQNDNPPTPTMYRIDGLTSSISWSPGQDIDFDGVPSGPIINLSTGFGGLRGYKDWTNIDLRQIGATGSLSSLPGGFSTGSGGGFSTGSGGGFSTGSGGGFSSGSGGGFSTGSGGGFSSGSGGGFSSGSGGGFSSGSGGVGNGEITHQTANSVVRPPRSLTDTPMDVPGSHSVTLNWDASTFGQVAYYNIYRGQDGATPTLYDSTSTALDPLARTFKDSAVSNCTTYTYFTSHVLPPDPNALNEVRESVGSNTVSYAVPCPPSGLTVPTLGPITDPITGSVSFSWNAPSNTSGDLAVQEYRIYRGIGTSTTQVAPNTLIGTVPVTSPTTFTDAGVLNSPAPGNWYTYYVTAVLVNRDGCTGANNYCRESDPSNTQSLQVHWAKPQTITFNPLPNKTWGDADFTVSATASSGLLVSFSASGNCTVGGSTLGSSGLSSASVHIAAAGSCTIAASQAGNADWAPAPPVPRMFAIAKANPNVSVFGYSRTYDGDPHMATGSASGVGVDSGTNLSAGLNLINTSHTNFGNYTDTWYYVDFTGNYNDVQGLVSDVIMKADPRITINGQIATANTTVNGYSVTYDGQAHTDPGSATGVKSEALNGLDLSGTTHTAPATYNDTWTFNDVTGNYNNASGPVTDTITKGNSTTKITSFTPKPTILGQSFTVKFTVSPVVANGGTPTGSVTVSDDLTGAHCTGGLTNGAGSCVLTLPTLVNGKVVVGLRSITANYGGDVDFTPSPGVDSEQVVYSFTGFLSPLSGTGTYVGSFTTGKAIPLKWQISDNAGKHITISNLNLNNLGLPNWLLVAFYNGPALANGKCNPPVMASYGNTSPITLLSPVNGVKGNSSFRFDTSNNQYNFNWDTSVNLGAGCYTVAVVMDDGTPQPLQATVSKPAYATSVQLK